MTKANKATEVIKHSIIYGVGSLVQAGLGVALLPILTGQLSKNDYGVYSLIVMATTIFSAVSYFGMTSALPRSYFDYSGSDERRVIFTTAFMGLALGAVLQTLCGYWGANNISYLLLGDEGFGGAVAWSFFGGALAFINQYFFTYLRLLRHSIAAVMLSLLSLVAGVGLTLWLLNMRPGNLVAPFEAVAYTQLLIVCIFLFLYARQAFIFKINIKEIGPLFRFGLAIVIANFGQMILDWADRIIIERYMTIADVGFFSAIVRVSALVGVLLVIPFTQIWSPMMMEHRTYKNIKQLFSVAFSYFFIIGGIIVVAATIFSPEILTILIKSKFSSNMTPVFFMLCLANLVYGSSNIVVAGILYERKTFLLPFVYYIVASLKLLMNLILIPVFGLMAAGASTLAMSLLIPMGIYFLAKKYFSFQIEWLRMGKLVAILSIPIAYAMLATSGFIPETSWVFRMIGMAVFIFLIFHYCTMANERAYLKNTARNFISMTWSNS